MIRDLRVRINPQQLTKFDKICDLGNYRGLCRRIRGQPSLKYNRNYFLFINNIIRETILSNFVKSKLTRNLPDYQQFLYLTA